MSKSTARIPANLDAMTGFDLTIYDSDGHTMDEVGMYAQDCHGYDRMQIIMLSFAKSLDYMFRFYHGNKKDRETYKAHLHDLERKLADMNKEID